MERHHSTLNNQEIPNQKQCWVCYGTDDEEFEGSRDWVSPCICRGSSQWVHQDCVQRWVDEKLKEDMNIRVCCPQCNTEYIIIYNEVNYFVQVLNKFEKTANLLCPHITGGVIYGVLYWSAVSYGAITVMQVLGEQEGINMMEDTNPYLLLVMLPAIPVGLIMGSIINWKRIFVQYAKFSLFKNIMPSFLYEPINDLTRNDLFNPAITVTNTLCSALFLPTAAIIVGNIFFDKSYSNCRKTLLGGLVYIAVKEIFKIYQGHHNAKRARTLTIIDYLSTENL